MGALRDAALTIVPWDSTCGADCLQQSAALSFIGQWSWPALQHAICCIAVAAASSTHVAHVDVKLALLTGRWGYTEMGLLDATHIRVYLNGDNNMINTAKTPLRYTTNFYHDRRVPQLHYIWQSRKNTT